MSTDIITTARRFAMSAHADTNHRYGEGKVLPYAYHLEMVATWAEGFSALLAPEFRSIVIAAAYLHDSIEDARLTYNDVVAALGGGMQAKLVADIVFDLTNNKGKTRHARADDSYYRQIADSKLSTYVKVCDRLANVYYSTTIAPSRMAKLYEDEQTKFNNFLFCTDLREMFEVFPYLYDWVQFTSENTTQIVLGFRSRFEANILRTYVADVMPENSFYKISSFVMADRPGMRSTDDVVEWIVAYAAAERDVPYCLDKKTRAAAAAHSFFASKLSEEIYRESNFDPNTERYKLFELLTSYVIS